MSNSSNTDPTTFGPELRKALHGHANWAHRWGRENPDTYIYGSGDVIDTVTAERAILAAHSQAIAEAVEAQEAKTLQDVIDWCNQMSRHEELDNTTLRAVQIGCEKALSSLRNPQPLKDGKQ